MAPPELLFIAGVIVGLAIAAVLGSWAWLRHDPKVEFRVTKEVLHGLNRQMVFLWLEANDLTWMPKGADFRYEERR